MRRQNSESVLRKFCVREAHLRERADQLSVMGKPETDGRTMSTVEKELKQPVISWRQI